MSYLLFNGRSAVHKGSKGKLMTVDVCLTQIGNSVVPIPYMNVAESKDADKTADTVTVDGNPACNQDSTFAKSRGDEPGGKKGIRSRKKGAYASFIMGSPTVSITGRPAVRALELMVSNAKNTPPSPLLQAAGMPPLAASTSAPEELEALEGPYHNAVAHQMPEGLHPKNFIGDLTAPEGHAIREVATPTSNGLSRLEGIQLENSALALGVRKATPWPHKAEGYLLLPLGEYDHFLAEEALTEGAANLAYFKLQRYLTPDNDTAQVEALRPGWLYVFVNGHLWRELEVNENGTFSDVDLRTWQGCDGGLDGEGRPIGRRATGTSQNYLELPYKMKADAPEVQVAFSEIQWSWKRIASLGGMDPEDPRMRHIVREDETLSGIVQCYPTVKDTHQMADLNGLASPDAIQVDQVLTVREADQPPTNADTLRQERMGDPINLDTAIGEQYTITMEDPLGVADLLATTMTGLMLTHQQVIGSLNGEHMMDTAADIDNARLSDYFWYSRLPGQEGKAVFPPEPPLRRTGENWRKHCQHLTETAMMVYPTLLDPDGLAKLDDDTRGKLQTAADQLDPTMLKDWLQVEERRAIRNDIRQIREALTEILWGKTEQTVRLQRVIEDYALQPTALYLDLWVRVNAFLSKTLIDPCNLDQQYDLPSEVESERAEDAMSGHDFMLTLLNPQGDAVLENWHQCLYPTEDQVDIFSEASPDLNNAPDPSKDHPYSPRFRLRDFADSIEHADKPATQAFTATSSWSDRIFNAVDNTLGLANSLKERLPEESQVRLTLDPIFRLIKGTKIPVLENMRLVLEGQDMTGMVAAGAYRVQKMIDVEHQVRLDHNERTKLTRMEARMRGNGRTAMTKIINSEGRVIGSDFISANSPYKGMPNPGIDKTDARQLFTTYGKTGTGEQLVRARVTVLAMPEERYRRVVTRLDAFRAGVKENIPYKSLPTGLLLLEGINFWITMDELFREDESTPVEMFAVAIGGTIKLNAAIISAKEAWVGKGAYIESLKQKGQLRQLGARQFRIRLGNTIRLLPGYKIFGIAGIMVDIAYTSKNTHTAIRRNDLDTAALTAVSGLLTATGSFLLVAEFVPVIGWALLIGGIIGFVAVSLLIDGPLESWAKNSPFAVDADNRLNGTDAYDHDMDTAQKALRQLQNLLLSPSIGHIRKSRAHEQDAAHHWVEADILLPGYNLDTSELGMRMSVRYQKDSLTSIHDIPSMTNQQPIEDLQPSELEAIPADDNNPHRVRLFYKQPSLGNKIDKYIWELRIQHYLSADLSLPLADPEDKDNTDSAWVIKKRLDGPMKPNSELPRTLQERIANYPEVEYADTAFRGEMESGEVWPTSSGPSGCTALPNNTQCHEYIAIDVQANELTNYKHIRLEPSSTGQAIYDAKAERQSKVKEPASYKFYNYGFAISLIGQFLMALAGYFAVIGFFASILIFVVMAFKEWTSWSQQLMEMLPAFLLFVGLPSAVCIIFKFTSDKDLLVRFNPTPTIRLALRRDKGMVEFKKKGELIAIPFSEIMGMTRNLTGSDGVQRLYLHLSHKHSNLSEGLDSGWGALDAYTAQERWIYHLRWELYLHYMDVTRPLPDIPEFEPYRHLDPTTHEWDKKHGRPSDYWLSMDQDTYQAMVWEAKAKAKDYPFDAPETADKIGWTSAGDGNAWYQLG